MKCNSNVKKIVQLFGIVLFAVAVMNYQGIAAHAETTSNSETIDGIEWEMEISAAGSVTIRPSDPKTLSEAITIPEKLNGYTVTRVGGFKNAENVKSIEFPNSITELEANAFNGCTGLKEVVIPEGVTYIPDYAFANCKYLESVTLPKGLKKIGIRAFSYCKNISKIEIPETTTEIGKGAFEVCYELADLKIGSHVASIGERALAECFKLESVTLPAALTQVEEETFKWDKILKTVTIQGDVSNIELNAFDECPKLEAIHVMDDNAIYSSKDGVLYNKSQTELILAPTGISGTYEISNATTKINKNAFYRCEELERIKGGAHVREIGSEAFYCCFKLHNITLFNELKVTGTSAFKSCRAMTEVTVPSCVTAITDSAFDLCENMDAIYVEEGNTVYSSNDGILYDKAQTTLIKCPAGWSKSTYKTPATLTTIKKGAFESDVLTNVELTEGVTTIEAEAFMDCQNLETITIPKSLTTIEADAFYIPFFEVEDYVDPFGLHTVYYNGTMEEWNQLMKSELNESKDAFVNVTELHCLGVSDKKQEGNDSLIGKFTIESEWDTAYNVSFTITNQSKKAINKWNVLFTSSDDITSIWCASLISHENGIYAIKNMDWNGTIQPGESVSFGFLMNKNGTKAVVPENIAVKEA